METVQHVNFQLAAGAAHVARMSDPIQGTKQIRKALEMRLYAIQKTDGYFTLASIIHRDGQGLNRPSGYAVSLAKRALDPLLNLGGPRNTFVDVVTHALSCAENSYNVKEIIQITLYIV